MPVCDWGWVMKKHQVYSCPTVPGCHRDNPAPVDHDQIRMDLRARLKRERNAADRKSLARRGQGK